MKKKHSFHMKSKHILVIMSIVCVSMLVAAFAADFSVQPLREITGFVVTPFEKGISQVSTWLYDFSGYFRNSKALAEENKELQNQVDELTEQVTRLEVNQEELTRLQELYEVDEEYSDYDKLLAQVIARESGNWYSSFTIDKGTDDGVEVDMNVIAAGGLVGLVTETGKGWATVRTIVDDGNSVSGMTLSNSDTCIVTGSLELMDSGVIQFSEMQDENGTVAVGQKVITSHISDKYLEGILIGTISSMERDTTNLTCSGYLIPAADFSSLQEVFVITTLKEQAEG